MIQTILLIVVFVSYITYILIREKKVLPSISDSWYEDGRVGKSLFTLFCFILGFIVISIPSETPLFFLAGSGFCFTGASPMFKQIDFSKYVHFAGALGGIILSFLGLYIDHNLFIGSFIWVVATALLYKFYYGYFLWWSEVLAFCIIIYDMILIYF